MNKKDIFIDYPSDKKRGDLANAIMRSVTILAIILMIVSSVREIEKTFYLAILAIELVISVIFVIDFLIRAHMSWRKRSFFVNVFNIFDLAAWLPFILAFWLKWYLALDYLKILRLTRICRLFRIGKYFTFLNNLWKALEKNAYKYKIAWVFFLLSWIIASFLMYVVEWSTNIWFSSIPNSMRWAIVTMSTVGYGDVYPISFLWKFVWGVIMLLWPIFVAIISSISIITFLDVMKFIGKEKNDAAICDKCKISNHDTDAKYCRFCGDKLLSTSPSNSYILDNY